MKRADDIVVIGITAEAIATGDPMTGPGTRPLAFIKRGTGWEVEIKNLPADITGLRITHRRGRA